MTPSPIRRHNPTLDRNPIWTFRRKIAGSAASTRSEMTERTVDIRSQYLDLPRSLLDDRLTALRKGDGFDLMIRQTHSIDAHIPVRSERSADSKEQEDAHCGK